MELISKKQIDFEINYIAEKSTAEFDQAVFFVLNESGLLGSAGNYNKKSKSIDMVAKELRLDRKQVLQLINLFHARSLVIVANNYLAFFNDLGRLGKS